MLPEMQTKRGGLPAPLPAQPEQRDVLGPWRHDRLPQNTPYFCRHPVLQTRTTSILGFGLGAPVSAATHAKGKRSPFFH